MASKRERRQLYELWGKNERRETKESFYRIRERPPISLNKGGGLVVVKGMRSMLRDRICACRGGLANGGGGGERFCLLKRLISSLAKFKV